MRTSFLAAVCLLLFSAPPSQAQNMRADDQPSVVLPAFTAQNPWNTPDKGTLVFHDNQRPFRLFEGNQIELNLWGGFQVFWDVNPLFGVNPYLTPYGAQFPTLPNNGTTGGYPYNPFNPYAPFAFPTVPIATASGYYRKPDSITQALGVIGFDAEVRPFERGMLNNTMFWSLGANFEIAGQFGDFPFDRSWWYIQALARVQSTPAFSDFLAFQGKFMMGLGEREWINNDFIFTMRGEVEASVRLDKTSRDAGFVKLGGRYAAEGDGVTAEMAADIQVGWRRMALPEELINEIRIYAIMTVAERRDYESYLDLQQEDMMVGVGGEVRLGPVVFTARLGYFLYNNFELTPLRLPAELQGIQNLPTAAIFSSNLYSPLFTKIETPGMMLTFGARLEF